MNENILELKNAGIQIVWVLMQIYRLQVKVRVKQ